MLYVPAPCTVLQLYDETMCAVSDNGEKLKKRHLGVRASPWTRQGTFQYMLKSALCKPCTGSRDASAVAVVAKYVIV